MITRHLRYAGSWYEADPILLDQQIDGFFSRVALVEKKHQSPESICALVVPHAGYAYSGAAAAAAYQAVTGKKVGCIFLLGPSHHVAFSGVGLPKAHFFKTPFGDLTVDEKMVRALRQEPHFFEQEEAHAVEHSLEMQLPFIKKFFPKASLVPLLVGSLRGEQEVRDAAASLKKYLREDDLIIVSSDFIHYGRRFKYVPFQENVREKIKQLDAQAYYYLQQHDTVGFLKFQKETGATICGFYPIAILLALLPSNTHASLLVYYTSLDVVANDPEHSVSYMAVAFSKKTMISENEKKSLLTLARATLEEMIKSHQVPSLESLGIVLSPALQEPRGAFVTLYLMHAGQKKLRGCIGNILPLQPLYQAIIQNAIAAATRDFRFSPVTEEELSNIALEINILTSPKTVASCEEIELGQDGIIFHHGGAQSVFLPAVPLQFGWDLPQTLSQLALKAGLSANTWQAAEAWFEVFQSEVLQETINVVSPELS
ncbi:MAG: AmmeMemoRadiSam system protein B [Chthoniobacterales bacterium]|nr:AmmeMemoRadiSam system protein B [Chthoniobacterales bacterium]